MYTLKEYVVNVYLPYFRYKAKNQESLQKDIHRINVIFTYELAVKDLVSITKNDVLLFLASIATQRKLEKSTVNRYRSRLMAIFNHAIDGGLITKNPVSSIKKHKESFRNRYLNEFEIVHLLDECRKSKNKELYRIVVLALNTGMRQGEILNLSCQNYDDEFVSLSGKQTKTGQARTVPLNDISKSVVDDLSAEADENGRLFDSKSIRSAFDYAKKRAGIKHFRFHDLRRTFATYLKDNNIDLHSIQQILGHSDITMTERYLGTSKQKILDSVKILSFK